MLSKIPSTKFSKRAISFPAAGPRAGPHQICHLMSPCFICHLSTYGIYRTYVFVYYADKALQDQQFLCVLCLRCWQVQTRQSISGCLIVSCWSQCGLRLVRPQSVHVLLKVSYVHPKKYLYYFSKTLKSTFLKEKEKRNLRDVFPQATKSATSHFRFSK